MNESLRRPVLFSVIGLEVITGLFLRTLGLHRPLWFDEAWVLDSVRRSTLHDMFFYTEWAQTTPPGVLLVLRAASGMLAGAPEALRWIPFVVSAFALVLAALLFLRTLPAWWAVAATFVYAVSPEVIWYATDIKQYAFDVAVSLVLLVAGRAYLDAPSPGRRWAWFGSMALLAPFSYIAIFLIPACACAGLFARTGERWPRRALQLLPPALLAATAAIATYLVFCRPNANLRTLHEYWAAGYWNQQRWALPEFCRMTASKAFLFLPFTLQSFTAVAAGVAIAASGAYDIARRGDIAWAVLLTAPFIVVAGANLCGLYPVSDFRLLYFLVGHVLLLLGAGLAAVSNAAVQSLLPAHRHRIATVFVGLTLLVASGLALGTRGVQTMQGLHQWQQHIDVGAIVGFLRAVDDPEVPVFVPASYRQLFSEYAQSRALHARIIEGEHVWSCCVPGKTWHRPEVHQADIEREVVMDVGQATSRIGASTAWWVLREIYVSDLGVEWELYEAALHRSGCQTLTNVPVKGARILKVDCGRE